MADHMPGRTVTPRRSLRRRTRALVSYVAAASILVLPTSAFANCRENAMIVFDASGSMGAPAEGARRIDIARQAIDDILPEVTATRPTGLVTYGGAFAMGCDGVELRLPPMSNAGSLIRSELLALQPSGQTPVSEATWLAAQAVDDGSQRGTVVVVTDGRENCGLSACALGAKLAREAPNIKVHVIGFHLRSAAEASVACLAQQTGGTYSATRTLTALRQALRRTLTCPRISDARSFGKLAAKTAVGASSHRIK